MWLVGVPSVAIFVCFGTPPVRGLFLDTSVGAAAKIRPGMTIAEVELIIGGPPGDYVFSEDSSPPIYVGRSGSNHVLWMTYAGIIDVSDGKWGEAPDENGHYVYWNTRKGTVDSVKWEPFPARHQSNWNVFKVTAAACFLIPLLFYITSLWVAWAANPTQLTQRAPQ
jgi:hypothetical protein